MSPEQLVSTIDFMWISDALTPEEAVAILKKNEAGKAAREAEMRRDGYPAYTTSTGWLGYSGREGASPVQGGGGRGLDPLQDEGGAWTSRTTSAAPRSCARRSARSASS